MAGKKKSGKGKRGKKREQKVIDEYQLRRDLRARSDRDSLDDINMVLTDEKIPEKVADVATPEIRIGGIEGGATHSTLVIINGKGEKLTEIKGPATNHWILGIEETAARINAMIERAKEQLDIPKTTPLDCVGLCLSGCAGDSTNNLLSSTLLREYPDAAKDYYVNLDTMCSLRTGLETGGIVLIAGTGSNSSLINPDGQILGCGGWGYMIGDEGSAYWIASQACKYVIDDIDDLVKAPYSTGYIWPAMKDFFKIADISSFLPHLYSDFNKSYFASFAKVIAEGCERQDPLCLLIFEEAGRYHAKHVVALYKKAHNDIKLCHGGLKVICVGSVLKSWKFLKKGFMDEIHRGGIVDELTLLRLTVTSALGACYLAAEKIDCPFVKPYDKNVEAFFHYKRDHHGKVKTVTSYNESNRIMVPCDTACVTKTVNEESS